MRKKNKRQKSFEAWNRVYENLIKNRDYERFQNSFKVTENLYGRCEGFLFYEIRHYIFHNIFIPEWLKSTNVSHRKEIYELVKRTLGFGLANELQLIDNRRTW